MAELTGPFKFKGSMGNMSCYWNSVLKKWILRSKGGSYKDIIMVSPVFARTRENMSEFKACGKWCRQIRLGLLELDELNYGMYMNGIVKLSKAIQLLDNDSDRGFRSIFSSKHKSLVTEINFNENHPFYQVLNKKPIVTSNADRTTVTVEFPQYVSQWQLKWKEKYFYYRFTLVLCGLSDYIGDKESKTFGPQYPDLDSFKVHYTGEWISKSTVPEDISITASFKDGYIPAEDVTVMVALGIEIGMDHIGGSIYSQKGDGTMAIVACL